MRIIQIERSGSTQDTYWATPIQPSYTLGQLADEGEIIERPDLITAVARSTTRGALVARVIQVKSAVGQYAGTTGRFFAIMNSETKQQSTHTPLPWRVATANDYTGQAIEGPTPNRLPICEMNWDDSEPFESDWHDETKANAAFIVRACNSHEELLAALQDIADADYGTDTPKLRERARAAIAHATGGQP